MIKRYLFAGVLIFAGMLCRAQSLTLEELQGLTAMTTDQVHNFLIINKRFKPLGKIVINGKSYEHFKSDRIDPRTAETLALGQSNQLLSGNTTRQVIYRTRRFQDLNSLYTQAKRSTMTLIFEGRDAYQNIYRFDNSLFTTVINVGLDRRSGTVQLDEK
jgi:hypothetical protein